MHTYFSKYLQYNYYLEFQLIDIKSMVAVFLLFIFSILKVKIVYGYTSSMV